ncbi:hypothetical protein [Methanocalculus sp.]|uniref:hypothetical protein n=1 Tax=Methanocalculus sp. TaxID=2004547 RepID=UPI00260EABB7|nr:hypothetical protein [Methanocalculus sp.]MDG6249478.1 hypothetical protein [Methanocalculus sp.]
MIENECDGDVYRLLKVAVIVATMLGVLTVAFFLIFADEPYTALYLIPDPSPYTIDNGNIFFTYGLTNYERGNTVYTLDFYVGTVLYHTETFSMRSGDNFEGQGIIALPIDASLPLKVRLDLKADSGSTESVHFWVWDQTG